MVKLVEFGVINMPQGNCNMIQWKVVLYIVYKVFSQLFVYHKKLKLYVHFVSFKDTTLPLCLIATNNTHNWHVSNAVYLKYTINTP